MKARTRLLLAFLTLTLMPLVSVQVSLAARCNIDIFGESIDDAMKLLNLTTIQTELSEAQYYAGKAGRELDMCHDAAAECGAGTMASFYFTSAANDARRAEDTDDPREFAYALSAAIKYFNKALAALELPNKYTVQENSRQDPRQPTVEADRPRGAINPRTGEYYPSSGSGVIDPKTGTFYPKSGKGYINPQTGEYFPGQ